MATKEEYLKQGYSEQQIQDATVAKNTAAMGQSLGQDLQPTTYNVNPAPIPNTQIPLTNQEQRAPSSPETMPI